MTQVSRQTGNYNFVRISGGDILAAADRSSTPQARTLEFLAGHGGLVGMNDAERAATAAGNAPTAGSDLQLVRTATDSLGMTHVRFNQFYQGLPVFGAQVVVHMNNQGITGVNGDYVAQVSTGTIPLVAESAAEAALAALQEEAAGDQLKVANLEIIIYPAGLLEGRPVISRLAYSVEVAGEKTAEQVWIDAQTGFVLLRVPLHQTALNRTIYSPQYLPDNPDLFVQRREGDPPHATPFVNNLYDFAGQTYNLYSSAFGRDSYDGLGHHMISVYLVNQQCPNAYWNGTSTNYCPIFDADDVVSHEWSHAYTEYTHGLIYAFQSGALNESYSDIFGETVDLLNGADGSGGNNNTQPYPNGQRWLVGEDLGQEVQELLLRDMYDPDRLADPGKVSSTNYACGTDDGGGVHTNSGVPNHAYALIVDGTQFAPGGSYNGQTITGIGMTKAAAIYFRAESVYQTPTTDFPVHAIALQTSCSDLIGAQLNNLSTSSATGTPSSEVITAANCQEVAKAMLAVEMSAPPACSYGPLLNPDPAQLCPGSTTIFSEDWESGEDGWTKTSQGYLTGLIDWEDATKAATRFFHLNSTLPGGRTGTAAFAINPLVGQPGGGTCAPGGDYSGNHTLDSPPIVIPVGATAPQLSFDHWVATEAGVDGGQVEISRNGGAYTLLPRSQYVYNPPNTVFNQAAPVGNNTNPNPGEDAWTGTNLGGAILGSWGTTVANLSSVAQPGDTIKIRFNWSQDGCNGVQGWYIDNVRVFQCPLLEAPVLTAGPDYENPDTDGAYTLNWTRPTGASGPDLLQVSQTSCAPLIFDNAENGLANWTTTTTGTGAQPWTTSTKPQHTGTTFFARGFEGVTSADSFLTYNNPITIPTAGQTFLNFSDWDNNEGDDNVIVEVSTDNGTTWDPVYIHNRSEAGTGPVSFATEPLFTRSVNLANYGGQTIRLRFHYSLGAENRPGSTPFGWYVDDIAIVNEFWLDVTSTSGTSFLEHKPNGSYCYRVRTTLTGSASGSTMTDSSGNYQFLSLTSGGSYTVTPSKAARTPGSTGIDTVDVIAVQQHYLNLAVLPAGCRRNAANVNGDSLIDTVDMIAIQRFFLGLSTGIANVGKYQFSPANRTYPAVGNNQTGQNYNALIFGDVASTFADSPDGPSPTEAGDGTSGGEIAPTVTEVVLPEMAVDQSKGDFVAAVRTSAIDAKNNLVGFQGDVAFDERVITFQSEPVRKAGITKGNWNVSGNVLPGPGPIRTLRISAYSNDFTPLSGSGTLFELRMTRVSQAAQSTQLVWAVAPDRFIFIDAALKTQQPGQAPPGSVTPSGKRK